MRAHPRARFPVLIAWALAAFSLCASAGERATLVPQIGMGGLNIEAIAYSPDGRTVLTAANDAAILWDAGNGRQLRVLHGHTGEVTAVAFSPDGRLVATGSDDHSVRLWDAATGAPIAEFDARGKVRAIAISAEGRLVIAATESDEAHLWQIATGREIRTFHGDGMELLSVAFSPDGRYVLTGDLNNTAILWNRETGARVRSFSGTPSPRPAHEIQVPPGVIPEPPRPRGTHYRWVSGMAFSPDGRQILTANEEDGALLWSTATGKKLHTFPSFHMSTELPGGTHTVAFSPDGRSILTASSLGIARTWDLATGDQMARFPGYLAVYSPDGHYIFTADRTSSAHLWSTDGKAQIREFKGETARVDSAGISRDGRLIVTDGADGRVRLWSVETGQETDPIDPKAFSGGFDGFAADGSIAIYNEHMPDWDNKTPAYKSLELKDPLSGKPLRTFKGDDSVYLSQDGRYVLTGSLKTGAALWDALGGTAIRSFTKPEEMNFNLLGEEAAVLTSTAFLPDGRTLLSSTSENPDVDEWDLMTGKLVRSFRAKGEYIDPSVSMVAISPDGRMALTGNWDGAARVWDPKTGEQVGVFKDGDEPVGSVAFSPDGNYGKILTGSWDHTARLWDRKSGRLLEKLEGHGDEVTTVSFAPGGRFALTSSLDTTAKLWDLSTGREILTLLSFVNGGWAVVDPEGRFDTNDLDGGAPLSWVVSSEPMRALPLEIFMRDYYTPRLLARIMNGETLPPVRSIAEIKNRVQPDVAVVSMGASKTKTGRADVVIHAASHVDEKGQASGLQDLRLFRNGQLVGYREGSLKDGDFRFSDIQLPTTAKSVTFTAYAFNSERIKSATAEKEYAYVPGPAAKARAWLLQIGVNHYEASGCELHGSANDAGELSKILAERLTARGLEVRPTVLVSTDQVNDATKAKIREALARIAAQATPEDVFFLSFSGHGYSNQEGQFYILPADVQGSCAGVTPGMLQFAISADDLTRWLRPIDAGQMTFILDSCDSASSVESKDFKPGPMGSPGLGQLAYDKRMRILAASQPNQAARESASLHQGLLSYALTELGLVEGEADWKPKDGKITVGEWLGYAADEVPKFVLTGAVKSARGVSLVGAPEKQVPSAQTPAVFDFSKQDTFVLQ